MKKLLLSLLVVFVIAICLTACGENPSKIEVDNTPIEQAYTNNVLEDETNENDEDYIFSTNTSENEDDLLGTNTIENNTDTKDEFVPETGAGSLREAIELFKKIDLGTSKDKVIEILGEPQKQNENKFEYTKSVKLYQIMDSNIHLLDVYFDSNNVVVRKYIPIGKTDESLYHMSLIDELGSDIEKIEDVVSSLHENMPFEDAVKVLGDKYFEKEASNEYFENHDYWWYDLNSDYIHINVRDNKINYFGYTINGTLYSS